MSIFLRILIVCLFVPQLFAAPLFFDPEQSGRPAEDLLLAGKNPTSHQLIDLQREGLDLSTLDPKESLLWTDKILSSQVVAKDLVEATFNSYLSSTKGLFRSSIDVEGMEPQTLTVSLSNHGTLLRYALLRHLGYKLVAPTYVKKLSLNFSNKQQLEQFLDALSDRSLTSRQRWIVDQNENSVILQDVLLEPGRVTVHPLHWGVVSESSMQNRRVFRALIMPYLLGDFYENANLFSWSIGKKFNTAVGFDYFLAESFHQTTFNDAKWAVRRIAKLTLADWEEIVESMQLPYDISLLLAEKLKSRRNSLVKYFSIDEKLFSVNQQVSRGAVKKGKLTRAKYDGYALEFATEDPENPLRFSELLRYFTIEGIGTAITRAMAKVNEYLQFATIGDAINSHREEIFQQYLDHLEQNGIDTPFEMPLGVWAKPIGGVNLSMGRSVVSGTYYGSDAPIQLVDNLGVQLNLGFFGGIDGTGQAMTSHFSGISLSRNYMHLRPVGSIKDALKTDWKDIMIKKYLGGLGKIISGNYECSVPNNAWVEEVTIDGQLYHKINYDRSSADQRKEAMELRTKLLADGISMGQIMLNPIVRENLCSEELDGKVDDDVKKLVKEMATGEMIVIVDGVAANLSIDASIPLSTLLGSMGGTLSIAGGGSYSVLKRTMITKTDAGFQVYLQNLTTKALMESMDLKYYLSLFALDLKQSFSEGKTKYFDVDLESADRDVKSKWLPALKSLLKDNQSESFERDLPYYYMTHDVKNKVSRWKILFKRWDFLRQEHELSITPPESERYINTDFTRKLFLTQRIKRYGFRFYGFFNDVLRLITGGFSFSQRENENTGSTFLGTSHWTSMTTEDELTETYKSRPVAIFEEVWNGWSVTRKKMLRIVKKAQKRFLKSSKQSIDTSIFAQTKKINLYEVRGTFIVYPKFVEEMIKTFKNGKVAIFDKMVALYGQDEFERDCRFQNDNDDSFDNDWLELSFLPNRHPLKDSCMPTWLSSVMRMEKDAKKMKNRKDRVKFINKFFEKMMKVMTPSELAANMSPDEYFVVVKLNGFRKGDSQGNIDYLSDTAGHYDNELGAGIFKTVSSQIGASSYEIYARYFAEGF